MPPSWNDIDDAPAGNVHVVNEPPIVTGPNKVDHLFAAGSNSAMYPCVPAGTVVAEFTTKVNDGDRGSVAFADTVMLTYAIPLMPVAPISRGSRSRLASAGAGEGDELKTKLATAEPAAVAGNPTVAESPLPIGLNVAATAAPPSVTDAADDAGSAVGAGVGVPPIGTTPAL